MDVMHDHGLKVTFHLEPYANTRAQSYADDVLYLVREYGDKRRWDAQLVLADADGREGPVFKSFATILPFEVTDCHGQHDAGVPWAPVSTWRDQTDTVREALASRLRSRAAAGRLQRPRPRPGPRASTAPRSTTATSGHPRGRRWRALYTDDELLFSFNINPGFDGIEPRTLEPDSCYSPLPFEPPAEVEWRSAARA